MGSTSEEMERSPPNGITVLISGSGVGGLMTALECWRIGCDVRVFERTSRNLTSGDSFTIGHTAIRSIKQWPWMRQRNDEIKHNALVAFHDQTGERKLGPIEIRDMMPEGSAEGKVDRHGRPTFHAMLLEQLSRVGLRVEYGREVVDFTEDAETQTAGVVFRDGAKLEADLVVAADGIRTASWGIVAGRPVPARSSGNAMYRVAYPVELALKDPAVAERWPLNSEGRPVVEMWMGEGAHCLITRGVDRMEWVVSHPDHAGAEESWNQRTDPAEVLKHTSTIPGWPEVANRLIMTAPADQLVDWRLMWRDPQENWTSPAGRVVQLGDAAHCFLPSSGNGATQAIEDAVSLATCISIAQRKEKLGEATKVHNLLRFERVSCLQAFGVKNSDSARDKAKDKDMQSRVPHFGTWIVEHDPREYARCNYEPALAHVKSGAEFKNTNTPPGVVYRPWTIDGLLEAQKKGEPTVLDGDWS